MSRISLSFAWLRIVRPMVTGSLAFVLRLKFPFEGPLICLGGWESAELRYFLRRDREGREVERMDGIKIGD